MNAAGELRERRARLLARAALEREQLSVQLETWRAPFALVDKSIAAGRYLGRHPQWIIAAAVLVVLIRPRRALAWARRGFIVWRTWRWIAATRRELGTRNPA